jgi:hypothetical protein
MSEESPSEPNFCCHKVIEEFNPEVRDVLLAEYGDRLLSFGALLLSFSNSTPESIQGDIDRSKEMSHFFRDFSLENQ